MIGNNSCGVHALMGGKTVDNIESLDVLLYDGTRMTLGPMSEPALEAAIEAGGRTGQIYAGLKRIRDQYASLVRERFPDIPRRVSGYNLDQLLPENHFNVARALVGSESTCVTVLEATVRLMKSPQHRQLVVLGFSDVFAAADTVPEILKHKPIGLEGFDNLLVDFLRRKQMAREDIELLPNGRGFLLVEFGGDTDSDAHEQADRLAKAAESWTVSPHVKLVEGKQAESIWRVRESALGAVTFVPGIPELWEGWEDSAVPPENLGIYLRRLQSLVEEFGYIMPIYGHFGQGCIHTRISYDMRTMDGVKAYREFIERAADIVLELGGSLSGEHGDGQCRGALLPKMFGPELMQAFREFKALWDPDNRMNPGKMMGTPDEPTIYQPEDKLRVGPGYQAAHPHTHFTFPDDSGSFAHGTMRCVGVGACRKTESGTMCPSYMATREIGRAHV